MKAFFLSCWLFVSVATVAQRSVSDSAVVGRTQEVQPRPGDTVSLEEGKKQLPAVAVTDTMDYRSLVERTLSRHRLLNVRDEPVVLISRPMPDRFNNALFYAIFLLILLLAFLRYFYDRYFDNMFRVFFNTTLRQSQLTDQLLQSKQVSLLYNLLFFCTGGLYIYVILRHFNLVQQGATLRQAGICAWVLAMLYVIKMLSLRFTGWLTGFKQAAGTYTFIIFLINKILGILLLPFVVLIAFGVPSMRYPVLLISLILVGLMLLLRFLRSYGLLRREIKVSGFHFFVYMTGVELLPLLLIYKAVLIYFGKIG